MPPVAATLCPSCACCACITCFPLCLLILLLLFLLLLQLLLPLLQLMAVLPLLPPPLFLSPCFSYYPCCLFCYLLSSASAAFTMKVFIKTNLASSLPQFPFPLNSLSLYCLLLPTHFRLTALAKFGTLMLRLCLPPRRINVTYALLDARHAASCRRQGRRRQAAALFAQRCHVAPTVQIAKVTISTATRR